MLSLSNYSMLFFTNINIFRHLKLEIVLAIPASNYSKIEANNSAPQGLKKISLHHKELELLSWSMIYQMN